MASVTQRIKEIKQPKGGYIPPSSFKKIVFEDGVILHKESISPATVGMTVDYLSRFMTGSKREDAFKISLQGYICRISILGEAVLIKDKLNGRDAYTLLGGIKGLDNHSITKACMLTGYDVWLRNTQAALMAKEQPDKPDNDTIENIRTMVERSIAFFGKYGPVTSDGFTFVKEDRHGNIIKSGYTDTVNTGDGDFLTKDTLWDFKVSKYAPTSDHTLQILMYWIMGLHSGKEIFQSIKRLGIYNPRLNTVYLIKTKDIPADVIKAVERNVICY